LKIASPGPHGGISVLSYDGKKMPVFFCQFIAD